jgi:hypothetical protein
MEMAMASFKFANDTGLSYKQTLKLGGALAVNAEGVAAIAEEFGNINNITTMMAVDMQILNKQYGISATASAKILKLQTATSGMSNRQLLSQQKQVAQMARLEGVSPAAVFESMAADSEAFAKFTKDSGKNLMKAAIQAKKLGLEMSAITGAAEGLLNLEDSLTKQMEASVLLGRDINLDRARSLALAGDISGGQQERVKAVGGENEWNSMNLIQRKALADAVGLQVSEVSKVVGAQNSVNKATEEGSKKQWGAVAAGAALGALLLGVIIATISAPANPPLIAAPTDFPVNAPSESALMVAIITPSNNAPNAAPAATAPHCFLLPSSVALLTEFCAPTTLDTSLTCNPTASANALR